MTLIEKAIRLADGCLKDVYDLAKEFPTEEKYIIVSQLKRACLSISLNLIEGHRKSSNKAFANFLDISRGSLHETKYLLNFSARRRYIARDSYARTLRKLERLGKMTWILQKKVRETVDCKP